MAPANFLVPHSRHNHILDHLIRCLISRLVWILGFKVLVWVASD